MNKIAELQKQLESLKNAEKNIENKMIDEFKRLGNEYLVGSVIRYGFFSHDKCFIKIDSIVKCYVVDDLESKEKHGSFYITGEVIGLKSHTKHGLMNPLHINLSVEEILKARKDQDIFDEFDKRVIEFKKEKEIDKYKYDKKGVHIRNNHTVLLAQENNITYGTILGFDNETHMFKIQIEGNCSEIVYRKGNELIKSKN